MQIEYRKDLFNNAVIISELSHDDNAKTMIHPMIKIMGSLICIPL